MARYIVEKTFDGRWVLRDEQMTQATGEPCYVYGLSYRTKKTAKANADAINAEDKRRHTLTVHRLGEEFRN